MCSTFARRLAGFALWLVLCLSASVWAEVAVPALRARVTDLSGTLATSQRSSLESQLQAIESRSGAQIAILVVPTTQPETVEQYSIRVAEAWKLGQKGKDNGLLLVVAKNDRKVRIEVGYGLEGVIPDAVARRVIDEQITPRFKQGDFAGGLASAIDKLASLIEGRPSAENPAAKDGDGNALPSLGDDVMDLTGSLSEEQRYELGRTLRERGMDRGMPFFVLIVPTTAPDAIAQYGARVLRHWGTHDNLDTTRSGVLVVARDNNTAHIELGSSLQARWTAGASESIVASIEPRLAEGDYFGALQQGVTAIAQQIDAVIAKRSFSERLADWAGDMPIVVLIAIVLVGTALRWILGPLFGALTTGGLVGTGAWIVSGTVEMALLAGGLSFVFVLVGLLNWIALGLNGSSGGHGGSGFSGGGGSFSGGGGSFGGGGASGSW